MEQPRRHDSSAMYTVHIILRLRATASGDCKSCGKVPRKSPRSPGPFLVVSPYTIWMHGHNPPHTSCAPYIAIAIDSSVQVS